MEDKRYESWLIIYHPEAWGSHEDECTAECSPSETIQNTVLADHEPQLKYPDKGPGSKVGARVLTSSENFETLNEKERKKEEVSREKQKRKEERERKKLLLQTARSWNVKI